MRHKAVFAIGLSAGYVLGSRAGRQRYEQIRRVSRSIASSAPVKHTTEAMQAQASQFGAQARRAAQHRAGAMGHELVDKVSAKVSTKVPTAWSNRLGHRTIDLDAEPTRPNGAMT